MQGADLINRQVQALESLEDAIPNLFSDAPSKPRLEKIINDGLFSPSDNDEIAYWFARFTTIRNNLWSIIETGIQTNEHDQGLAEQDYYQHFVIGYSAVCTLIRIDRFLLDKVAYHTVIQRKLNEAFPEHRIPRKQFHKIRKAMLQPSNAIRIYQAHRTLKRRHKVIELAVQSSPVTPIFEALSKKERYLNLSRQRYFLAWLKCRILNWRRRGASAKQKTLFSILEYSGRLASELSLPRPKKVTPTIQDQVLAILEPGDIFITRHSKALTNLFLPGFWPHAALYIGLKQDHQLEMNNSDDWHGKNCTFEALKDGVHFRPLSDTLNVDAFVILRPNFSKAEKSKAIARVIKHHGKGYNFDFDFFRADRLVCTEVIYRAFDNINEVRIPLEERMGRQTLSAENIIDLALDTQWAKPIAIFGVGDNKSALIIDDSVNQVLQQSYRR